MNNNEMLLLKLGEVVLKGLNRRSFEDKLVSNVRRRMKHCGSFQVYIRQSTIYVEPQTEECDMEAAYKAARQIFGIVTVARAVSCDKTMDAIVETAKTYLADEFAKANEAGMGSTPHAHAQANVATPHDQGVVAMVGVFIDTFVVLTLNALVIICTLYTADGPLANGYVGDVTSVLSKTNLAQTAFGSVMGTGLGAKFVAICLFFFAFSTVLSWNLFGKINAIWLFGRKNAKTCTVIYTLIALVFILLGTMMSNDLVWELTDMFNNLMVIPNAIALFALTGMVVRGADKAVKS